MHELTVGPRASKGPQANLQNRRHSSVAISGLRLASQHCLFRQSYFVACVCCYRMHSSAMFNIAAMWQHLVRFTVHVLILQHRAPSMTSQSLSRTVPVKTSQGSHDDHTHFVDHRFSTNTRNLNLTKSQSNHPHNLNPKKSEVIDPENLIHGMKMILELNSC